MSAAGKGEITTEIAPLGAFYYAEDYHQQYLSDAKNPNGYCNHGPNGLTCPRRRRAHLRLTQASVPHLRPSRWQPYLGWNRDGAAPPQCRAGPSVATSRDHRR